MKLSKEERVARKAQREAEDIENERRFPYACFASRDGRLQLILDPGLWGIQKIRIRTNDLTVFTGSSYGRFYPNPSGAEWVEANLTLEDIEQLAKFVKALTARLVYLIEEANQEIEAIPQVPALTKPTKEQEP
jgi:hypothetical protein